MKVDQEILATILKTTSFGQSSKFVFGGNTCKEIVLPIFCIHRLGIIPVPVTVKAMNQLKNMADASEDLVDPVSGKLKRNCWELDACSILHEGASAQEFFKSTIPALTAEGLAGLGLDMKDISHVEPRLSKMLIFERGSYYSQSRVGIQEEKGMFGVVLVQIPVKNGHAGGLLKVEHCGETRIFDYSFGSNFYTTIFYSDCHYELEALSQGWRLVMVFNLFWKYPRVRFAPLPLATDITFNLSPWLLPDNTQQRLLVIRLEHKYAINNLSFCSLKGRDRLTASLLRSVEFIDLHLVIVNRQVKIRIQSKEKDGRRSRRNRCDDEKPVIETIQITTKMDERVFTDGWIWSGSDEPIPYNNLEPDFNNETVLPVFNSELTPDKREFHCKTDENDFTVNEFYYETALVIWPKYHTIDMACRHGFIGALDILEHLTRTCPREEVLFVLGRTVTFCCVNPRLVWAPSSKRRPQPGEITCRLLKICLSLNAVEQGLILLNLLGEDYSQNEFEGVQTDDVAVVLAQLMFHAGWNTSAEAIYNLVTPQRLAKQMGPLASFAINLLDLGMVSGTKFMADRLLPYFFQMQWNSSVHNNVAVMIFRLEEVPDCRQHATTFISMVEKWETEILCNVVVHVRKSLECLIKRKSNMEELYRKICRILVKHDFTTVELVDVMECFLWLEDSSLLMEFVKRLKGNFLQLILSSESIWNVCLASTEGKIALQILVDARIEELNRMECPEFTWEQPEAILAGHPDIELFFHSKQNTAKRSFRSLNEARSWAMKVFGNDFENTKNPDKDRNYSATIVINKLSSSNVVCEIVKNRRLYEFAMRNYRLKQQELKDLTEKRLQLATDCAIEPKKKRVRFNL